MVKPLEYVDHVAESDEKFLSQYKGSENFVKLVKIFLSELTPLEDMYSTWTEKLNLDTATGVNLDYWRDILDSDLRPFKDNPRPENDDVFRSLLYALIGAYNSDGTARAIQQTLEKVLKADRVYIDDNFDGSFTFEVDNPTYIFGKDLISNIVRIAKPVGVEFLGYTVTNAYGTKTFGFFEDNDENTLGFAVLASADVTTGIWENYHCAAAGEITTNKRIETIVDQNNLSATMSIIQPKTFDKEVTISYEREDVEMENLPSAAIYSWDGSTLGSAVEWTWQWNNTNKYLQINTIDGGTDYANYRNFIPSDLYGSATHELIDANGNVWTFTYPFRLSGSSSQPRSYSSQSVITFNGEPYDSSLDYPEVPTTVPADATGARYIIQNSSISTYWAGSPSDDFSYVGVKNYYYMDTSSRQYVLLYESLENLEDGSDVFIDDFKITESFGWQTTGSTNDPSVVNMRINQPVTFTFDTTEGFSKLGNLPKLNTPYSATEFLWLDFQPGEFFSGSNTTKYTLKFSQFEYLSEDTLQFTISSVCLYTGVYDPLSGALIGMTKTEELDPADPDLYLSWRYGDIPRLLEYTDVAIGEVASLVSQYDTMTLKQCETTLNNGIIWFKPVTWEFQGIEYSQETFPISGTYGAGNFTVGSIDIKKPDEVQIIPTDGEDFVDDILNEFNGVIGSKVGYELTYKEEDPVIIPEVVLGPTQVLNIDVGGLESNAISGNSFFWNNRIEFTSTNSMDDQTVQGDAPSLFMDEDILDNPSQPDAITLFIDTRFEQGQETWYNEAKSKFSQGDYLRFVTRNNQVLDMKVNCPPEDFLKPTAKWSDRKVDNSILTLPGIPYDIPPALEYDFPDFQPAVQVVALGTNTAPSFYQVQMFTSYKDPQGNIMNNFNYLKEAWESLNKRRGSWYMYAATGEFVEFRLRDFNYNEDDYEKVFEVLEQEFPQNATGYIHKSVSFKASVKNLTDDTYRLIYDTYIDGVLQTDFQAENGNINTVLNWFPSNFTNGYSEMLSTFASLHSFNIPTDIDTVGFNNARQVGFKTLINNYSYILFNDQTNTTNADCWVNGLKMSTRSAMDRMPPLDSSYKRTQSAEFEANNPSKSFDKIDKPKPLQQQEGFTNVPFVLCLNDKFVTDNDRVTFNGGILKFVMDQVVDSIDFVSSMTNLFGDGNRSGKNLIIKDRNGIEWSVTSTEDSNGILSVTNVSNGIVNRRSAGHTIVTLDVSNFAILKDGQSSNVSEMTNEFSNWVYSSSDDNFYSDWLNFNGDQGFYSELPLLSTQWLIENLSSFDIVNAELIDDDYWKIDIDLSTSGVDHVALFQQGVEQVIMQLSAAQIEELNINSPTIIPFLIKETGEGDGAIPDEGYSTKGGGRFALLNV